MSLAPPCSWHVDELSRWLGAADVSLGRNRLLVEFGYGRTLDGLWIELDAVPYVQRLRTPAAETREAEERESLSAPDRARERRMPGPPDEDDEFQGGGEPTAPPRRLDEVVRNRPRVVILGDPGSGKTSWL